MNKGAIIILLLVIAGGVGFLGWQQYEESQVRIERDRAARAAERAEREAEQRRRAEPCYGITLSDYSIGREGSVSFFGDSNVYYRLDVEIKNTSNMTKIVTVSYYAKNGGRRSKEVKVYAGDIARSRIADRVWSEDGVVSGFFSDVKVASCR